MSLVLLGSPDLDVTPLTSPAEAVRLVELTQAQRDLVLSIPDRHPIERIDRIWIFPPHAVRDVEMGLLVLSVLVESDSAEQRGLYTLRYQAERTPGGSRITEQVEEEEGRAPSERIERVIEGVARRGGTLDGEPFVLDIASNPERWTDFIDSHVEGSRSVDVDHE